MGDAQQLTPDEQIRSAREAYENGSDFTLAVEEEFAVLDPETLSLANRFEERRVGKEISDNREEARREEEEPFLLAPVDLHAIKACSVTFRAGRLEGVI